MIREELIKKIRATRGKIYADIKTQDSSIWVAVEKADLISGLLRNYEAGQDTQFELTYQRGEFFFGREY